MHDKTLLKNSQGKTRPSRRFLSGAIVALWLGLMAVLTAAECYRPTGPSSICAPPDTVAWRHITDTTYESIQGVLRRRLPGDSVPFTTQRCVEVGR